jgi:hypothetical protein
MTARRLAAWAQLALQAPASDAVLLTDSPAAWDLLTDRFPATEVLAHWPVPSEPSPDVPAFARWRADLLSLLDRLAGDAWPPAEAPVLPPPPAEPPSPAAFTLQLALVPETPLPTLLAGLSAKTPAQASGDSPVWHCLSEAAQQLGLPGNSPLVQFRNHLVFDFLAYHQALGTYFRRPRPSPACGLHN